MCQTGGGAVGGGQDGEGKGDRWIKRAKDCFGICFFVDAIARCGNGIANAATQAVFNKFKSGLKGLEFKALVKRYRIFFESGPGFKMLKAIKAAGIPRYTGGRCS